jgi:large subunit ribosomal protein L29
MTKAAELREHDTQELNTRLVESRKELFNLRFQLATGRLDNISRITEVRREIARILTLLGESTALAAAGTDRNKKNASEEK